MMSSDIMSMVVFQVENFREYVIFRKNERRLKMKESYEDRLIEETDELRNKLEGLREFIASANYLALNDVNVTLLAEQYTVMRRYLEILELRLEGLKFSENIFEEG